MKIIFINAIEYWHRVIMLGVVGQYDIWKG
jgi:hypothetical protein